MARMPMATFLLYSTLGTLVWTAALALAGRLVGANFPAALQLVGPALWLVVAGSLVAVAYWAWKRHRLDHATQQR